MGDGGRGGDAAARAGRGVVAAATAGVGGAALSSSSSSLLDSEPELELDSSLDVPLSEAAPLAEGVAIRTLAGANGLNSGGGAEAA